jgi:hypothetical protein
MPYESSSAASDVSLARVRLRMSWAMQPSAERRKTAECVAKQSSAAVAADACCVAIAIAPLAMLHEQSDSGETRGPRCLTGVAASGSRSLADAGKSLADDSYFVRAAVCVRRAVVAASAGLRLTRLGARPAARSRHGWVSGPVSAARTGRAAGLAGS